MRYTTPTSVMFFLRIANMDEGCFQIIIIPMNITAYDDDDDDNNSYKYKDMIIPIIIKTSY